MSFPEPVELLIAALKRQPGIGRRSATRLALHLVQHDTDSTQLLTALTRAMSEIGLCPKCRNLAQQGDLCSLCLEHSRSPQTLCVVEKVTDIHAFERSGRYRGRYFVLGGVLSPLDGIGPEHLGLPLLFQRCRDEGVEELILALGSSAEAEATSHYIDHILGNQPIRRTRLARGIPMGTDLDYLDEHTLGRALEGRTSL